MLAIGLDKDPEIELQDDWGIFYPGCAHHQRPSPAEPGLVRTPYALDTHAFAVKAPYFKRVMAALRVRAEQEVEHARASDWFLADLHREIPTYACYPNLAWQAVSDSDLAGGVYSNYTPSGEQRAGAGEIVGLQAEMWGGKRWISPKFEIVEDSSLTHFAFVSEHCIPVRPCQEMARRLRIDPRSLQNYRTSKDMKPHHLERLSRVRDLPDRCRRMHSQWCLLARDAAECVAEYDFTAWFEGFLAPDEHYIGSVLALRGFDEDGGISKTETTWLKWNTSEGVSRPLALSETDAELARSLAAFPGFFARKFAPESDVGKWGLHHPTLIHKSPF